ncbi:unnamed protein product [Dovyalis caffra]|uniref:Uncharacterized protein n=1 Tax=Dovyalis caffra TaxID=77055 RepID=A0AAV1RHQ2_9ROSI|nr:unnamed protein product [Dovyalis caffra]
MAGESARMGINRLKIERRPTQIVQAKLGLDGGPKLIVLNSVLWEENDFGSTDFQQMPNIFKKKTGAKKTR